MHFRCLHDIPKLSLHIWFGIGRRVRNDWKGFDFDFNFLLLSHRGNWTLSVPWQKWKSNKLARTSSFPISRALNRIHSNKISIHPWERVRTILADLFTLNTHGVITLQTWTNCKSRQMIYIHFTKNIETIFVLETFDYVLRLLWILSNYLHC